MSLLRNASDTNSNKSGSLSEKKIRWREQEGQNIPQTQPSTVREPVTELSPEGTEEGQFNFTDSSLYMSKSEDDVKNSQEAPNNAEAKKPGNSSKYGSRFREFAYTNYQILDEYNRVVNNVGVEESPRGST